MMSYYIIYHNNSNCANNMHNNTHNDNIVNNIKDNNNDNNNDTNITQDDTTAAEWSTSSDEYMTTLILCRHDYQIIKL